MKKRIIALMTILVLSISLSACGGDKPTSSNNSEADKTEDTEAENRELKEQPENPYATDNIQQSTNEVENLSSEIMAYITDFDANNISVDAVEWVTVPSSRADELGLQEDDYPNGFCVYNPDTLTEHFNLSTDCIITILDWKNSYESLKVSTEEFTAVLQERGEQNNFLPFSILSLNFPIIQ